MPPACLLLRPAPAQLLLPVQPLLPARKLRPVNRALPPHCPVRPHCPPAEPVHRLPAHRRFPAFPPRRSAEPGSHPGRRLHSDPARHCYHLQDHSVRRLRFPDFLREPYCFLSDSIRWNLWFLFQQWKKLPRLHPALADPGLYSLPHRRMRTHSCGS